MLLLLALACNLEVPCNPALRSCLDPPGENPYEGELELAQVFVGCCRPEDQDPRCGARGSWWVGATLEGSAELVTVDIREASPVGPEPWSEQHKLALSERDPDGWWELRYRELQVADLAGCRPLSTCAARYLVNRTTLFACEEAPQLSFTLQVYEDREGDPTLCRRFGAGADTDPACPAISPEP